MRLQCPKCREGFQIDNGTPSTFTTDCAACGRLLHVEITVTVRDFHEVMHERNSAWPVDGSNTGYINLQSPDDKKIDAAYLEGQSLLRIAPERTFRD